MKNTNLSFIFVLIFQLFYPFYSYCDFNYNCPESLNNLSNNNSVTHSFNSSGSSGSSGYGKQDDLGGYGTAEFKSIRLPNSYIIDLKLDYNSFSFQNNTDFVSNSALKKILERDAVRKVLESSTYEFGIYSINVYFITKCKKKVKRVIRADVVNSIICPENCTELTWDEINQVWLYPEYKYVECAEDFKCCRRTYICNKIPSSSSQGYKILITSYPSSSETVTDCSSFSESDCGMPGQTLPIVIPCEGDCEEETDD